jgi:hypothetical protein
MSEDLRRGEPSSDSHLCTVWWLAAVAFGIVALTFTLHARGYFFLYDDFALVRQGGDSSWTEFVTVPLFGFFRPLAFGLTHVQVALIGWEHPAAYAASAIVLHLVNASLVGVLARRLGIGRRGAFVGAVLFALSAPAAEIYFWLSCVFDRLSALGILGTLLCGHAWLSVARWERSVVWAVLGIGCAAFALLSKETAVVLPVLTLATLTVARDNRRVLRIGAYVGMVAVVVAAYLMVRRHLLPGLTGAYGDWRTLFLQAPLVANARSFVLAHLRLPLPGSGAPWPLHQVSIAVPVLLTAAWAIVCVRLGHQRAGLLGTCLLSASVSTLPVIWAAVAPGSSSSGRFLYVAGIWLALLPAAALDFQAVDDRARRLAFAVAAAVSIMIAAQTASVVHQARIWTAAANLSRQTIEWMRPYRSADRSMFITNLPAVFVEGPYILKDYAFASYFGPSFKPRLRVRRMALRWIGGRAWFAGWMDQETAVPGERSVTLRLPIEQRTPHPRTEITSPNGGANLSQPFILSGWSVDPAGPVGCGVDLVDVYARVPGQAPRFLGAAVVSLRSSSAEALFGSRYCYCGWTLKITDLPPGPLLLTVHPFDNAIADFTAPETVSLTIDR